MSPNTKLFDLLDDLVVRLHTDRQIHSAAHGIPEELCQKAIQKLQKMLELYHPKIEKGG